MAEIKYKILIVEDDIDVAEMLDAYFRVQGYDVDVADSGKDAVEICWKKHPDLVILDIRLPDVDGFEVARRLKSKPRTVDIPIIFLTEKRTKLDIVSGLELGVDDYITKPFDIQELRLRVKNSLQNIDKRASINLITGLPEGILVDERLAECIHSENWALILITLGNFESFREAFDFVTTDDVLRAVGLIIQNAIRKEGNITDFVGHLDRESFILVTTQKSVTSILHEIENRLEQYQDFFYPLKDRSKNNSQLHFNLRVVKPDMITEMDLTAMKELLFKNQT